MYIIGITPGVYTVARAGGAEAAREFAGLVEKISYGYTVGCNFFQIDQEAFGEFLEPNLLEKLSNVIEKMNIEWALHGFILEAYYETLDYMPLVRWKLAHLILHRDLQFLYEFLIKAKNYGKSPKVFPHYTIYHSSAEMIVGYGPLRGIAEEAALVNPLGELSWSEIIEDEKRKILKEWFLENLLPVIYSRIRVGFLVNFFEEFFEEFSKNLSEYFLASENNETEFKNKVKKVLKLLTKDFLTQEKITEIENLIDRKNFEELKNEMKDLHFRYNILIFLGNKEILGEKFEEWKNWLRKNWKAIKERAKKEEGIKDYYYKSISKIYEAWKILTQKVAVGNIPYEDAITCLLAKDIEFSNLYDNYESLLSQYLKSKKIDKLLFEEYIKKIEKEKVEEIGEIEKDTYSNAVEKHVSIFYEGEKELINFYKLEINLTPSLNTLTAIIYWIFHFIVSPPLELKDEVVKRTNFYHIENLKRKIVDFSKKNAFEKLKEIIKELREWGVKRKTAFFIGVETPEGRSPEEGLRKICHLKDVFILTEALNIAFREYTKLDENAFEVVIDTEHLLSNAFEVEKEITKTIEFVKNRREVYSRIAVYHIGTPKPYGGTTHIPFDIGSDEQLLIYKYCYMLKELGFRKEYETYLIFERGGGRFPYEFLRTVILALRKIVEYLEKDISPKEIESEPMKYIDFFGLSYDMFNRWRLIVQQHALEPLKGLIVIPEEEHTYLGREAIEKFRKKPEEWKAEELK
ncbi:MAG: hypothetical protein QXQ14_00700 [Candidatus Aenigmatarchaeota archaeon]